MSHDVLDPAQTERHPTRPLVGLLILALPLPMVAFVIAAYGVLVGSGLRGIAGSVPIELGFDGCPAAAELVRARVVDMGYEPALTADATGFVVAFDGPADPDVAASLPRDLARTGAFEARTGGAVLATNADVVEASVRVDALMTATTLVRLRDEATQRFKRAVQADPLGATDFFLDGERIGGQAHDGMGLGELEIAPSIANDRARMAATAAWGVVVDHGPLPCAVTPRR